MSPPIPPATVAIPPTTRPDPPPLDWNGPHRRLDRAAQEMMGGEGRPVLGAAGARSRFVIVHHPTPAVRLDRHDPRLLGPQTLGVNPCRVQGGERPRPYEAGRSHRLPCQAGAARPRSASARRLALRGLAVAPLGLSGLAGRLAPGLGALRGPGLADGLAVRLGISLGGGPASGLAALLRRSRRGRPAGRLASLLRGPLGGRLQAGLPPLLRGPASRGLQGGLPPALRSL